MLEDRIIVQDRGLDYYRYLLNRDNTTTPAA